MQYDIKRLAVMPLFFVDNGDRPKSPTQLNICKMNIHDACDINSVVHSRLPIINWSNVVRNKHYCCYSATFGGVYYAVAIWSTPVAANRMQNGDNILELRRMAISRFAPKNTATYMISRMVKDIEKTFPNIVKLISYQDTEVHNGTIYKASNWVIGSRSQGSSWTTERRLRNAEQTTSDKIRWEYTLKRKKEIANV